jgi:phytoene dehydrogenase-like protein
MSSARPVVLVIGGGLGGLASAILLQRSGYDAHVLEAAPRPGGVALTRHDPAHTIEGGLYFILGHAPGSSACALYTALGLLPAPDLETVDHYVRLIDETTGTRLDVTRDLTALRRDLLALAPDDRKHIDTIIDAARAFHHVDLVKLGFEKPAELQRLPDKLALAWHARRVLSVFSDKRLLHSTMTEWLADAKSPLLRALLLHLFPYPTIAPWFIGMLLGQLSAGQVARVTGSADAIVDRLVARLTSLGGRIDRDTRVTRILVDRERTRGVQLADGTTRDAHAVISTVDTAQLHHDLLHGRHLDDPTRERLEHWPRTAPAAFVHFITRGAWPDEPWLQQLILADPPPGCGRLATVRFFAPGVAGAAPDETVVQFNLEVPVAWSTAPSTVHAETIKSVALATLARRHPDLTARIARTEVVLPDLAARVLSAPNGVTSAWLPTPKAMLATSPRRVPHASHLYLAGQWAIAGAGVLVVLHSGSHAVQLLCHDDRRRFAIA